MKKSVVIGLYIVTLYYLLPFRPVQLYYYAQNDAGQILFERNPESSTAKNGLFCTSGTKTVKNHILKKQKLKFFFGPFRLSEFLDFKLCIFNLPKSIGYFHAFYSLLHTFYYSDRAPPLSV